MRHRAFLAGGVVHGASFALLVAAIGVAGGQTGLLSRAISRTALVSAAAGVLSPLYVVAEPAAWFIPVGRFPGLFVAAVAGARLARSSRSVK